METDLKPDDRLKLLGVKALATGLNAKLEMLREMTVEITGETGISGHCSDFLWDDEITPEDLWSRTAEDREAGR